MKEKNYEIFLKTEEITNILSFHLPRWNELPTIDLYMDQVLKFINDTFANINIDNDKYLTKSMINNYVKNKIIKAPENKKYDRSHLVYLMVILVLKDVFSINEISLFIQMQEKSYGVDVAFDYFGKEIENVLVSTFKKRDESIPYIASHLSKEIEIVRSSIITTCNKLFAQSYIKYLEMNNL